MALRDEMRALVAARWRVGESFALAEAYAFQVPLSATYPDNRHLTDSIRVGLQQLRRDGIIEMLEPGRYRRIK